MSFSFEAKRYPTTPGCYLMKDNQGKVIYAGKAKNLRSRLASYFNAKRKDRHTRQLVANVADIELILVHTETESWFLESTLIRIYYPLFNRMKWREEVGRPYIALTDEAFPRFVPFRKHRINKALNGAGEEAIRQRFGPYVSTQFRDAALEYVCSTYRTRVCNPLAEKVCLLYHLRQCSGICENKVSAEQYAADIQLAIAFLSTYRHSELLEQMKNRMWACAENLEFEKAERIRASLEKLETALECQAVEHRCDHDRDVIYCGDPSFPPGGTVITAHLKRGSLEGLELYDLEPGRECHQACEGFILEHYARQSPPELIVNCLDDLAKLAERLTASNGYPITVKLSDNSITDDLMDICKLNYEYRLNSTTIELSSNEEKNEKVNSLDNPVYLSPDGMQPPRNERAG